MLKQTYTLYSEKHDNMLECGLTADEAVDYILTHGSNRFELFKMPDGAWRLFCTKIPQGKKLCTGIHCMATDGQEAWQSIIQQVLESADRDNFSIYPVIEDQAKLNSL